MSFIFFFVVITMSRTCTYVVFVEQIHQISFRACYIIVVILQRWVSVVVKIAGLLQWEQTGCIPSTTPLPETECFFYTWKVYILPLCCVLVKFD